MGNFLKNGKDPCREDEKKKDDEDNPTFPRHIAFILANEFCERYGYYGFTTLLVLYLRYFIGFSSDTATVLFHAFRKSFNCDAFMKVH